MVVAERVVSRPWAVDTAGHAKRHLDRAAMVSGAVVKACDRHLFRVEPLLFQRDAEELNAKLY